ncbi:hypothetical protein SCALM49S_03235 [Streptomyces californicus]
MACCEDEEPPASSAFMRWSSSSTSLPPEIRSSSAAMSSFAVPVGSSRAPDADADASGLAGDFGGALAAFDTATYTNRLGLSVRADRLDTLRGTLAGIAAPLHAWYGVRVFTDNVDNDVELPADEMERVLLREDRAGRTDPYRGVVALLHLCGVRG